MWYKKFGWKRNPFLVKFNTDLVGLDEEKRTLLDYVNSGDICIVVGDSGVGKTSMLKWLEKNLGKYKVNYLNAEGLPEFFSLRTRIKKGWFKPTVLLLDEAQCCDENIRKELKLLWDSGYLKSVVIAQTNERLHDYSDSFKSRVGKRHIRMKGINRENAAELIKKRTKENNPFSDDVIKMIVEDAKKNPRKILEDCELLCIELQGEEITKDSVTKILKQRKQDELFNLVKLEEPALPDNLVPIDNKKLKGFSPMQKRLIMVLLEGDRTAKQLAKILNSSEGSVGKQISKLSESGVIVTVNHRRPKVYGLSKNFKSDLQ